MKILKRLTIFTACFSLVYFIGYMHLWDSELSYREWFNLSGKVMACLVLPALLLIMAGYCIFQVYRVKRIWKTLFSLVAGVCYLFYAGIALFFIGITTHPEERLTAHLLVANETEFLESSRYVYYRPVGLFFRLPGELTDEVKQEYLEEKYDKEFGVGRRGEGTQVEAFLYDKAYPSLEITVYGSGMELLDDYPMRLMEMYIEQGIHKLGIDRDYEVSKGDRGSLSWPKIALTDEADIGAFSEGAYQLIQYVMEESDFFRENRGLLYFYCGEGEEQITGYLPVGKLESRDNLEKEYYLDRKAVAARVRAEYDDAKSYQRKLQKQQKEWEKAWEETLRAQEAEKKAKVQEARVREEAAAKVYDAVLREQGYTYEEKYNAKGNLYIDLGSRAAGECPEGEQSPEDAYDSGIYRFSLVYDRQSKNGACELFVLYKDHYTDPDSTGKSEMDATVIVDMYVVENATGRVIGSGKRDWGDRGSEEYRKATGE